jgi:hypothetical protein
MIYFTKGARHFAQVFFDQPLLVVKYGAFETA